MAVAAAGVVGVLGGGRASLEDRRRNIRAAEPKSGEKPSGRVAGRILSDGEFEYSYGARPGLATLRNGAGEAAEYDYDAKSGTFSSAGW